ncbi:MAG: hypothetical protein HUU21_12710 [Polyangiaceae bacterium]|nr:hypothetical protein [Polyangiaceae bacterium]NUQ74410.1 hypothetical protein [Polyangiaceae bacterium]
MAHQLWKLPPLLAVLPLLAACGSPPKPPPPPPDDSVKWTQPEASKEPPKCEALKEKCSAKGDTNARIGATGFGVTPIEGWTYAQGDSVLVAQKSDEGAAMAATGFDVPMPANAANKKQEAANRKAALEAAAKEINVTIPKKEPVWTKPADFTTAAPGKVNLWGLEGAARGDKKGFLLVFLPAAPVADGKSVVGIGFIAEDDEAAGEFEEAFKKIAGSLKPYEKPAPKESGATETSGDKKEEEKAQ